MAGEEGKSNRNELRWWLDSKFQVLEGLDGSLEKGNILSDLHFSGGQHSSLRDRAYLIHPGCRIVPIHVYLPGISLNSFEIRG